MSGPTRRELIAGAAALGAAACSPRVAGTPARGMVATTQRPATDAGLAVLRAGGGAADAAIAAAAALAVTEPMSTGLGGDCFAVYYDARTRRITALNGSGRAPAGMTPDLVRARGLTSMPDRGALAVTVPGACAGWFDLIAKHGRLPMARILEPAIELAERGFAVAPWTAFIWDRARARLTDRTFLVDDRAPHAGERFQNPELARTLRAIAAGGKDAFYRGHIAETIVAAVQQGGGVLELADLGSHTSTWDDPISTVYRDHTIWECPPNGQGLVPLLALNILEQSDLHTLPALGPERLHLVASALRLAFADARAFIGDPHVSPVPVAELLAKSYARERAALITPGSFTPIAHGSPLGRSDTVYLCTVDADGNACSFINSNFNAFGSGLVTQGFALQNRGASFVLDAGHPDVLAPGKRPYHTIIPGMITRADHTLYAPFGVMGGFMQPQGHVQVVTALLDDGLTPQAALDRPRICLNNPGSVWPSDDSALELLLETGISTATSADLQAMGYKTRSIEGFSRVIFGRGQIIRRSADGVLEGGSDPRGDGYAG